MNEKVEEARQIVFDLHLSGNLYALFGYIIFSSYPDVNKQKKDEFGYFMVDILLDVADKDPEKIIELYRKDELCWWVRATIRHQLWNEYSIWNKFKERAILVGTLEDMFFNDAIIKKYGYSEQ